MAGCRYPLSTCAKIRLRYNWQTIFTHNFYRHRVNEGYIMSPNIGVLLVIGFPAALLAVLWIFDKVSVRPE